MQRRNRVPRTVGVRTLVVLALVAALVAAGCSRGPRSATTSPLTGGPVTTSGGPVLAVKIDNTRAGRPWTGVGDADVVYVEPVEGGATRLLAVFASRLPPSVGPVRSFRESDLEVLAAYGRPALVFSGLAPELAGALAAAPVVPLSPQTAGGAFRRDPDRSAPANLYADTAALAGPAADASPPGDVGFTFGPAPAGGAATPVTAQRRVRVGQTTVGLTWDARAGRWTVAMDGRPADGVAPATVVVQTVTTRASSVRDVAGAVSPFAETVGEGPVEVLRDGRAFAGTWSRTAREAATSFTTADGASATFAPGPVWVLLVPRT